MAKEKNGAATISSAKKIVARWLKNKLFSYQEIREKLQKKNFPPEIIAEVLEKSRQVLNNELLARNLIEHYQQKKIHPRLIQEKLRQRKIPEEIISRLLPESENNSEDITSIISNILPRYQHLPPTVARRRLAGYLQHRGYLPEEFSELLQKLLPEREEDI